jgi:hypothetical protein
MGWAIATDSPANGIPPLGDISLAATPTFRLPFLLVWKALTKGRVPGIRVRRP